MAHLIPFHHELEMRKHKFKRYSPSKSVKSFQALLRRNLEEEWNYRKPHEKDWRWGIRRFNQLVEPIADPRLSNILFPVIKTVILAWLSSITENIVEADIYGYRPGANDEDKVELWKDMRRHTDNMTNMPHVLQQAFLYMAVTGNAPLEDGFQNAFMSRRGDVAIDENDNVMDVEVVQDPKRTRVFTRALSPFHHSISPAGQDQFDSPHQSKIMFYDWDSWAQEFGRVPNQFGEPLYLNTKAVQPGKVWVYDHSKDRYEQEDASHNKVAVITQYCPILDLFMVESNGVMNWIGKNPYKHGEAPFSLLQMPPTFDMPHMQTQAIYGEGFPKMLNGLDPLFQGVGNMAVDSLYHESSTVISVPTGLNLDIDDIDFYMGTVIEGGGQVVTSPLGKMSGNQFQFMEVLNNTIIALTGMNFHQLTGDSPSTTAFELSQKIRLHNKRAKAILLYNATGGLKKHAQLRLSNNFQFLPVETFEPISNAEGVQQLVDNGSIPKRDVIYENGLPKMLRRFPEMRTKGRVIKEQFKDGKAVPSGAKVKSRDKDGTLPIRPEYIHPEQWLRTNGIPEVYIEVKELLSNIQELDQAKAFKLAEYAQIRNADEKDPGDFDMQQIDEDVVRSMEKDPRKYKKGSKKPTEFGSEDTQDIEEEMRAAQQEHEAGIVPTEEQQTAPVVADANGIPSSESQISDQLTEQIIPQR